MREYSKGYHTHDDELGEHYLDWYFLHHFKKGQGFWMSLPDDKIEAIMTLQNENEKKYWETWQKLINNGRQ